VTRPAILRRSSKSWLTVATLLLASGSFIQAHADDKAQNECAGIGHVKPDCIRNAPAHAASMPSGEVKAINPKANAITLKLAGKKSETKTFTVQKPAMLASVREGDKVKFTLENINGKATITELQPEE
jgi:Cu/Ag efflux protein CusF